MTPVDIGGPQIHIVSRLVHRYREAAQGAEAEVESRLFGSHVAATAQDTGAWQYVLEQKPLDELNIYVKIAISDPIQRVIVWPNALFLNGRRYGQYGIAHYMLNDQRAALHWHRGRNRGGPHCVRPFTEAAVRVLHARVFGYAPVDRDVLLAAYATRPNRPLTQAIVDAPIDVLAAADLLYEARAEAGARALFATQRRQARSAARRSAQTQLDLEGA